MTRRTYSREAPGASVTRIVTAAGHTGAAGAPPVQRPIRSTRCRTRDDSFVAARSTRACSRPADRVTDIVSRVTWTTPRSYVTTRLWGRWAGGIDCGCAAAVATCEPTTVAAIVASAAMLERVILTQRSAPAWVTRRRRPRRRIHTAGPVTSTAPPIASAATPSAVSATPPASASAAPVSPERRSLKPRSFPRSHGSVRSASSAVAATNEKFQPRPRPNSAAAVAGTLAIHSRL